MKALKLSLMIILTAFALQYTARKTGEGVPMQAVLQAPEETDEHSTVSDLEDSGFLPTFANVNSLKSMDDLQAHLYTIDGAAFLTEKDLDAAALLSEGFEKDIRGTEPKVLIFHTHSQEAFADSRPGYEDDTIVGVGAELARVLTEKYNISVVHDVGTYDLVDGKEKREGSYASMEPAVRSLLRKYPSIEVVIDMHRDGVPDNVRFVTEINGKDTARIMFFNGVPKDMDVPYIKENLALSLTMQLTANTLYPGLARKIYIKPYKYSLHMLENSMLVEIGANTNTVEEAKNAMEPLADIINCVFAGED